MKRLLENEERPAAENYKYDGDKKRNHTGLGMFLGNQDDVFKSFSWCLTTISVIF